MKTFNYKGYKVTIFKTYNGTKLFINDSENIQIYAHKISGNAEARAIEIINRF